MGSYSKGPQGITFYRESLEMLSVVSDAKAGQAVKAAAAYYLRGETVESEDEAVRMLVIRLQADIDKSLERYEAACERRRRYRERVSTEPEDEEAPYVLTKPLSHYLR